MMGWAEGSSPPRTPKSQSRRQREPRALSSPEGPVGSGKRRPLRGEAATRTEAAGLRVVACPPPPQARPGTLGAEATAGLSRSDTSRRWGETLGTFARPGAGRMPARPRNSASSPPRSPHTHGRPAQRSRPRQGCAGHRTGSPAQARGGACPAGRRPRDAWRRGRVLPRCRAPVSSPHVLSSMLLAVTRVFFN